MKNKSYNFRIYPNKTQQELLAKTFGSNRFIYNQMLNERIETYHDSDINAEIIK